MAAANAIKQMDGSTNTETHHHQHLFGRLGTQRIQLHNELAATIYNIHAVALVGVGAVRVVKQVSLWGQGGGRQHQQLN